MNQPVLLAFLAAVFVLMTIAALVFFLFLARYWIRALMSGTPASLLSILGMRLRGNPPALLVDAYIMLKRGGADATISDVERTYMDNRTRIRTSQDLVSLVNRTGKD